ncbi:LemA family protein [Fulvimarina sp. MAC8]|uniref:LemA family protein n=1 Tax=Fulvimarina sp. MAC8 TaxID=3162874 RepID=UPI0032EBB0C9
MGSILLAVIVLIALLVGGYVLFYNGLVASAQRVDEGWSGITVQLKRRHDLVPNLVSSVGSAMTHERSIVSQITNARRDAMSAMNRGNPAEVSTAEAALSASIRTFVAYSEDNPEITATANIREMQSQLEKTEDQIAAARRIFNGNVMAYNTRVLSIPSNVVASIAGFTTRPMFELDRGEMAAVSEVPKVQLPNAVGEAREA